MGARMAEPARKVSARGRTFAAAAVARYVRRHRLVDGSRPIVLICDEDRAHTEMLTAGLSAAGWAVELTRSYAEAFALACSLDLEALVCAPFLRDGSALALPASLGIRRPPNVVLASRMPDRIADVVVRRVGFDAQLTKVVDPAKLDRLLRFTSARKRLEALRQREQPNRAGRPR